MAETILYRGDMPTAFFSANSVEAAIRSGLYRRTPLTPAAAPTPAPEDPDNESSEESTPPPEGAMDINTASLLNLQDIDGIGIARAQEIIAGRPYKTIEDLIEITSAVDWLQLEANEEIYLSS